MTRNEAISFLLDRPVDFAHLLGFNLLTDIHNAWIVDMVRGKEDKTLQSHRGSYKTTCVAIALVEIIILMPSLRTLFLRKTDTDTKEVMAQVRNVLLHPATRYFVQVIWGVELELIKDTANEITTNLCQDVKGTAQLSARGIKGSLTGKHFDRIFTDDIVNLEDRSSRAERNHTKTIYQELQNIRNRGGRIFNTGTPWHKDDAFSLMPAPVKYDCYKTGLISKPELDKIRDGMTASLFAANYELRHIASDDVLFVSPNIGADPELVKQGTSHVDAAYGGEDYTAFTICRKHVIYHEATEDRGEWNETMYYVYGRLWHKHVDDCTPEITQLHNDFLAGKLYCEKNADKGYLKKHLKALGIRAETYSEDMNKYIKISAYLKPVWRNIYFVEGTDEEYINQVCDYNEDAEHDDAPDSLASIIRKLVKKSTQ
jgi:hypothetical protein